MFAFSNTNQSHHNISFPCACYLFSPPRILINIVSIMTNIVTRSTNHRAALGDRTNNHVTFSSNKGNTNPPKLPLKPRRAVQIDVDKAVTTTTTNEAATDSIGKGKIIVEQDNYTQQPTKTKRLDVSSDLSWDDVASDTYTKYTGKGGRPSIVSPAYSDEGNTTDVEEEEVPIKYLTSVDPTVPSTTVTCEIDNHTKAVSNGFVFSDAFLEKSAREVLRPLEGESIQDAIRNMKKICLGAMQNAGENWKSIVENKDKYNLLSSSKMKSKIVFKSLFVLGVLDVVGDTISKDLPPTMMKSCTLGRSKAIEWVGPNKTEDLWIPGTNTIYQWYRNFTNGRFFRHPERAMHTEMQSLNASTIFFSSIPPKSEPLRRMFNPF
mmetsp:Transcript_4469/g.10199  ORF Transcript_4469/g.10199 Transcript_4469/m.10199 type:complete len:378 (+) Transcript_4469:1874-3007(+)